MVLITAPTAVSGGEPSEADLREAVKFRQTFGLKVDQVAVRAILADRASSTDFGTPLTADETREMERRLRLNDDVDPVERHLATFPDVVGGLYIDQEAGGEVVVQLASKGEAADGIRTAVRKLLPDDVVIRFENVSRTDAELTNLQATLDADLKDLRGRGIDVQMTAVDVPRNTVILGVNGVVADEVNYIRSTYGPAVTVEEHSGSHPGACTRTDCSGYDLRGGLRISNPYIICTSAFVGRARGTTTLSAYLLTAGHCATPLSTRADQYHPSTTLIGTVSRLDYRDGGSVDAAALRITNSRVSNYIWRYSDVTTYPITGIEANADQSVGEAILKSGQKTNLTSGTITLKNATVHYGSLDLYGMNQGSYTSEAGDSGSPVFASYKAYGIHSGNLNFPGTSTPDPNKSWYSPIDTTLTSLNLYLCFNAACTSYGW
jgi:hypothetical protein